MVILPKTWGSYRHCSLTQPTCVQKYILDSRLELVGYRQCQRLTSFLVCGALGVLLPLSFRLTNGRSFVGMISVMKDWSVCYAHFSLARDEDPPAVCEISPLVSYFGEVRLLAIALHCIGPGLTSGENESPKMPFEHLFLITHEYCVPPLTGVEYRLDWQHREIFPSTKLLLVSLSTLFYVSLSVMIMCTTWIY